MTQSFPSKKMLRLETSVSVWDTWVNPGVAMFGAKNAGPQTSRVSSRRRQTAPSGDGRKLKMFTVELGLSCQSPFHRRGVGGDTFSFPARIGIPSSH
jgi:hypothetical protein